MFGFKILIPPKAKVHVSKHAKLRMLERNISFEDFLECLKEPVQLVYDSWNDVYIAVSIRGFAIVYAFKGNRIEVLTVLGKREYEALASKYDKRYKVIM